MIVLSPLYSNLERDASIIPILHTVTRRGRWFCIWLLSDFVTGGEGISGQLAVLTTL